MILLHNYNFTRNKNLLISNTNLFLQNIFKNGDYMNQVKNTNNLIQTYEVFKQKYTPQEEALLVEIRENLVDLAISTGENFQLDENKLLKDIKNFLLSRLSFESDNVSNEYVDSLAQKLLQDIVGYGQIDPLVHDDDLEEIMIIGINKPVFVYHRKYGMMKTNIVFRDEEELIDLIDVMARQINRRIDQESPILNHKTHHLYNGIYINCIMNSQTLYSNGNSKAKDPSNIKYEFNFLKEGIKESKVFNKFIRKKIAIKEETKQIYLTHITTYCYFLQEPIEHMIKRYKKNQKELAEDEDEDDLEVVFDLIDYVNHGIENKLAKTTIQNKIKRVSGFLRKSGITVPKIDTELKSYHDDRSYFTRKDLPDKETIKTVVSESKAKYKAIFAFMYVSGTGRAETVDLTVKSFIDGIGEFSEKKNPRDILKDIDGHVIEKEVIPIIRLKRRKTGRPYFTVITPEATQMIIDYIKTDLLLLDNLKSSLFGISRITLGRKFQDVNLKHSWGKRGRNNFFSPHRLRHNHYTQINNPALANALEGRVNKDIIDNTYGHNLDDPDYVREQYKDHMYKFEIFDHYDVTVRSEEIKRLQDENKMLRNELAKTKQAIESIGQRIDGERTNIPFHKVHDIILSYLSSIGELDNDRVSLLNLMVLDHVKNNPSEFKDTEEYLLNLVKKLDIQIELSKDDILQQHEDLAQNMQSENIDPMFINLLNDLLGRIKNNEGVMKRIGTIDIDKFDYVAEDYLVNSGIIPDISNVDLSQFTEEDKDKFANEILMMFLETN